MKGGMNFMINEKRLIDNFLEFVKIDSETTFEKEMCDHLFAKLTDLGFDVTKDEIGKKVGSNGYNIIAKYAGNPDKKPIILSSHVDTVTPGKGIKPIIEGDVIKTDGTTILGGDDKSGVAIIVECMQTILENNMDSRPIEAIFTIYEEGGLKGSKNLDYSLVSAKEGIVIDSGGPIGEITTLAPGQDRIEVVVHGKAAHAGMEPEAGVSALQIVAEAITKMKLYRVSEDTTANFGMIHGGVATNIITDKIELVGEARSLVADKITAQTESMVKTLEETAEKLGGSIEAKVTRVYNPLVVDESSPIIKDMSAAFKENNFEPKCVSGGGGSDTNNYTEHDINCINISCGMAGAHTLEEHIKISDIVGCAKSLLTFLTK